MRIEEIRGRLTLHLRARRPDIEQATLVRIRSVSDPAEHSDPEYSEGLREAVAAAIDYGIAALDYSEDCIPPIPTALLSQARLAARNGIKLETILRRYVAGYTLFGQFLLEESGKAGSKNGVALKPMLRMQAGLFDRVIAAVSEEYERESADRYRSPEKRLGERVARMLNGERLDISDLAYDFNGWHLGAIARGPGASEAIDGLARSFAQRPLLIRREDDVVWAWFGARRGFDPEHLDDLESGGLPSGVALALGEPGEGLAGWRVTHCQARAALSLTPLYVGAVVHYADVALPAAALQDELLATSLRQLYLEPLERARDGGEVARQTLRAYFAADRNISSTAAALQVGRRTVATRLCGIEELLSRPLKAVTADLEVALRLGELDEANAAGRPVAPSRAK